MSVTLVVPLFNKAPFIRDTLESALAQTFPADRIIVVNNASTDGGPDIVAQLASHDGRITLLHTEKRGPGYARNYGVRHATTDWILFLDADDLLEPPHLASLMNTAAEQPSATVIAGGWQEFTDGSPTKRTVKLPAAIRSPARLLDGAIATSPWAVHAALVKRSLLSEVQWPEELDQLLAEDNAFWFSVCLAGKVAYARTSHALYRLRTADSRTRGHEIESWFEGVHAAAQRNLALLRAMRREPTPYQAAALMRLYSGLYVRAASAQNAEYARRALVEATDWLDRALQSGHPWTPAIALRRAVGIATTERLRKLLLSRR